MQVISVSFLNLSLKLNVDMDFISVSFLMHFNLVSLYENDLVISDKNLF